jgi:hypothetical protein
MKGMDYKITKIKTQKGVIMEFIRENILFIIISIITSIVLVYNFIPDIELTKQILTVLMGIVGGIIGIILVYIAGDFAFGADNFLQMIALKILYSRLGMAVIGSMFGEWAGYDYFFN